MYGDETAEKLASYYPDQTNFVIFPAGSWERIKAMIPEDIQHLLEDITLMPVVLEEGF